MVPGRALGRRFGKRAWLRLNQPLTLSSIAFGSSPITLCGGVLSFGKRQLFGMNDGFVCRRPRGAEAGELGINVIAPQNIDSGNSLSAVLVSHE